MAATQGTVLEWGFGPTSSAGLFMNDGFSFTQAPPPNFVFALVDAVQVTLPWVDAVQVAVTAKEPSF